jgi:hypothetical protein
MMETKLDLIGTLWICPLCQQEEVITKDGVLHNAENHQIIKTLDQLWKQKLVNITPLS